MRRRHPEPRPVARQHPAVVEPQPAEGLVGEQQVAVEVDPVDQRGDLRRGRDSELGLDHAAEHHAQPEGARRVDHPHSLAQAAGLGELDVDAVGVGRRRGDVAKVLAALVDDHRRPRAAARAGA